jgi:DNA-binding PadR family transcriptional regulator
MKKPRDSLTEFEGALLADIRRHGTCTAYRIRRAFETSRSLEWSRSAGAVYPAIQRLAARGLIVAEVEEGDGRGTQRLSLSEEGKAALQAWATDVDRAVGPGIDPFRTRSSEWAALSPAKRRVEARKLEQALHERVTELELAIAEAGERETSRLELDLALQKSRLEWLRHAWGSEEG